MEEQLCRREFRRSCVRACVCVRGWPGAASKQRCVLSVPANRVEAVKQVSSARASKATLVAAAAANQRLAQPCPPATSRGALCDCWTKRERRDGVRKAGAEDRRWSCSRLSCFSLPRPRASSRCEPRNAAGGGSPDDFRAQRFAAPSPNTRIREAKAPELMRGGLPIPTRSSARSLALPHCLLLASSAQRRRPPGLGIKVLNGLRARGRLPPPAHASNLAAAPPPSKPRATCQFPYKICS